MRHRLAPLLLACALLLAGGCASGDLRIRSKSGGAILAPRFVTAIYAYTDDNTVDIILSDLPEEELLAMSRDELLRTRGNIMHIHQFFRPAAGRTALDPTASNTTVRHIVLAGGEIGVYGGGGLLLPGGDPGERRYAFRLNDATMRLLDATPGFQDLLGGASLSGGASATRDDDRTVAITRLVHQAVTLADGAQGP